MDPHILELFAVARAQVDKPGSITGRAYVENQGECPDGTGRVMVRVLSVVAVPADHPLAEIDQAICPVVGLPTARSTMTLAFDTPEKAVDAHGGSLKGHGLAGIATSQLWSF